MPLNWKIFRIICVLQIIGSTFFTFTSIYNFFRFFTFGGFIGTIHYLLMLAVALLALNILGKNYPDNPITGSQKSNFNRLYLLNFLSLVFMFGFIFSEYKSLQDISRLLNVPLLQLPLMLLLPLILQSIMLIFQLTILYGLYDLRRLLYFNFVKKKFEFERD